jgi:CDP-diacylglycerol--glycerol-3-phosphate 3-phosphatidyltransferase
MEQHAAIKKIIPNALSMLRILLCVALAFLPLLSPLFLTVYLLAGVSDMLDGFLARRWGVSSRLGAYLDSAADFLLCAVLLFRMLPAFAWPRWSLYWVGAIALLRLCSLAVCSLRFRRATFLHSYLNKATGLLLLCFPFLLHFLGLHMATILACSLATLSATEELLILSTAKALLLDQPSIFSKQD